MLSGQDSLHLSAFCSKKKQQVSLTLSDRKQNKLSKVEGFLALLCCAGARTLIISPDPLS